MTTRLPYSGLGTVVSDMWIDLGKALDGDWYGSLKALLVPAPFFFFLFLSFEWTDAVTTF